MNCKNFFWSVAFLLLGTHLYAQPTFIKDSLETYIRQGMKDYDIPGLSIAIIKDGKTVMLRGFGVKDIKSNEPVDENTLFFIASNTKLFTGTALAQLETNKKLSLNDKITKYFPWYKLFDSSSTNLVTIRDLLSHRIGTKTFQNDFTFWDTKYKRKEIMEKMATMKPIGLFRQNYGYCNSCFLTAGEIIPQVTGKPWEVYVYDSIIAPLGMTQTQVLGTNAARMQNIAKPYTILYNAELTELPYDNVDNIAPAASIVSNATDMSKWIQMQLDSGFYNGKRILNWSVLQKTRDINIATSSRKSSIYPVHFKGYGLGVFMSDYNGRQIFYHTGGACGFVTNTCFVPEEKLGIVILTNQDGQNFFESLRYQILDAYLENPKFTNWERFGLGDYQKEKKEARLQLDSLAKRKEAGKKPNLSIDQYVGTYKNDIYGVIEMSKSSDNQLFVDFKSHQNLSATLTYLDNDEWELRYSHISFGLFKSKFDIKNKSIEGISIKCADFIEYDPYYFTKSK